jgi:hypothetical protein
VCPLFGDTASEISIGSTADGQPGADRALAILCDEVDRGLAMIGCPAIAELDGRWLTAPEPWSPGCAPAPQHEVQLQ